MVCNRIDIYLITFLLAKLFVIWGWPLTADTFREALAQMQKDYVNQLRFQERLAAAAFDKLFGSRISKAFCGFIGMTMNRGMKKLNEQLITHASQGALDKIKIQDFMNEADLSEDMIRMFFESAMIDGIDKALDKFWDLSNEELAQLAYMMAQQGPAMTNTNNPFGIDEERLKKLMQEQGISENDLTLQIENVNIDDVKENTTTTTTTTTTITSTESEKDGDKKPLLKKSTNDDDVD